VFFFLLSFFWSGGTGFRFFFFGFRLEQVNDKVSAFLGHLEALHAVDSKDFAGRGSDNADRVLWTFFRFLLFLLCFFDLGLGGKYLKDYKPGVICELRPSCKGRGAGRWAHRRLASSGIWLASRLRSSGRSPLSSGDKIAHDDFAVAVLRNQSIREKLPVAGELLPLNRTPAVIVVVRERAFFV